MKTPADTIPWEPCEEDIRSYAYHLYVQSGCRPDRDLENWLEAKACLTARAAAAGPPRRPSRARAKKARFTFQSPEAKNLAV